MKIFKHILVSLILSCAPSMQMVAQDSQSFEAITIQPLFEYPMAPEEMSSLVDKSNWLMQHFWDPMNFKSKTAVDQNALNDAFSVFTVPMQWADRDEALKANDRIIKLIEKNPTLLLQFTKAAEISMYDPSRARYLIDEVYMKYLEAILKNKKIPSNRKLRYEHQLATLTNTQSGTTPHSFDFTSPTGDKKQYRPNGIYTIIEFGNPSCTDCRHSKLKLETNAALTQLVDQGKVNILFIIPDAEEGWQTELAGYSPKWAVGASDSVDEKYDLRLTPAFYIIGPDDKVIAKNITAQQVIDITLDRFKDK